VLLPARSRSLSKENAEAGWPTSLRIGAAGLRRVAARGRDLAPTVDQVIEASRAERVVIGGQRAGRSENETVFPDTHNPIGWVTATARPARSLYPRRVLKQSDVRPQPVDLLFKREPSTTGEVETTCE